MSAVAPLAILLALGGGILASARLARNIKRQREGFAGHDNLVSGSQQLYNPLTSLMDILQVPFSAQGDVNGALSGTNTRLPSKGAPMNVKGKETTAYKIPPNTNGLDTMNVQMCEAVNTATANTCAAFDDPKFAGHCGVCFKPGTNSQAQNSVGGLFLSPDDKTSAELQAQALGESTVNYNPSVGTCPPGFFMIDKASCQKLAARIDCQQKKTYSTTGCSQCYTNGEFDIVDASVSTADLSLFVSFIGTLTVSLTGGSTVIATSTSSAVGDKTISIGQVPEGSSIVITLTDPNAVIGGFIQGPTVNGNFQFDLAQLADADLTSGAKPRFSGEVSVGGASCIAMKPGRGRTTMSLRVNIPMTFVDVNSDPAGSCTTGPFLTQEASATTLSSGTCFGAGNGPGAYSLDCLQEKFTELGCTTDGTEYPKDTASAAALNTALDGTPRALGDVADYIYQNALIASTGVSSTGVKQSLSQWNDASMMCTGKQILNACDAAEITGSMTQDCMGELWTNKGQGNRLGATYTSSNRNASLKGNANKYCTSSGLLSPFGPDGTPQQSAIERAFSSGGTIQNIKDLYDQTHRAANNNGVKDADRAGAIKDCYGVSLDMPTVAPGSPPQGSDLAALKAQYDSVMADIRYLSNIGLGPGSGNATFNDRYAKKVALDKQIQQPIKARYVRITPSLKQGPDDRCMQISQLQVFNSSGQEVAKGKPTSGSSIYPYGNPTSDKAVDGNAQARSFPNMYHDACDTQGANQFWMVDLGSEQPVSYVVYYNRVGCCTQRSDGMPVQLLDSQMNIVGQSMIVGSTPSIQLNFTVFDAQNLPWANLA